MNNCTGRGACQGSMGKQGVSGRSEHERDTDSQEVVIPVEAMLGTGP